MTNQPAEVRIAKQVAFLGFGLFAGLALFQWVAWGGSRPVWAIDPEFGPLVLALLVIVLANLGYGAIVIVVTFAFKPLSHRWTYRAIVTTVVAAIFGVPRIWALLAVPSTVTGVGYDAVDWLSATFAALTACSGGYLVADFLRRLARADELRREQARRDAQTIASIESEEAAMRQRISERLHGQVQNKLVMITASLDQASLAARSLDGALAGELSRLAEWLEEIRESDVRSLSRDLFPAGAELGVVEAVSTLIDRLPPSTTGHLSISPALREQMSTHAAPTPMPERLVVAYAIEEALTNAVKHGRAVHIFVELDVVRSSSGAAGQWVLRGSVEDDGSGLGDGPLALSGLARQAARFEAGGGRLELMPSSIGGARVQFELPYDETHL